MERMESMEPISAYYTTAYPEIQPDSGYGSRETTDNPAKTPPAPTYDEELVHKTILVGDSGVGKTSLLVQFDQGKFIPGSFSATVGIGFTVCSVEVGKLFRLIARQVALDEEGMGFSFCTMVEVSESGACTRTVPTVELCNQTPLINNKVVTVDDVKVKLQIWDTAGQERFRSVTHAYYRDAHALLLLYDITSKSSFDNIRAWLTEIHEYAQSDVVIMLLGNKADMSSDRAIRRDEGERLAREYSVPFMETSAKTGVNVDLAFTAVAKELKHRAVQHPNEPKFQIHEYIEAQKEKSGCCSYF